MLLTSLAQFLVVLPQFTNPLNQLLFFAAALVVDIVVDEKTFQLSNRQRVDLVARCDVGKSDTLSGISRRSLHAVACVVTWRRHFINRVVVRFAAVGLRLTIVARILKSSVKFCNARKVRQLVYFAATDIIIYFYYYK